MTYYLAREAKPDNWVAISVKQQDNDGNPCLGCLYGLEEIDQFTTQYNNLNDMLLALCCDYSIRSVYCSVAIVCSDGCNLSPSRDFLFAPSKEYLNAPDLAIKYVVDKFNKPDIDFFRELAKQQEFSKAESVATEIASQIEQRTIGNIQSKASGVSKNVHSLIYKEGEKAELDYESFHKLVSFIADYERKLQERGRARKKSDK